MTTLPAVAGICAANTSNISGFVKDYNGTGIAGATVTNESNISTTATTNSLGYFNLSCVGETNAGIDADAGAVTAENMMLVKAAGFTEKEVLYTLEYNTTIEDGTTFFNDTFAYSMNISLKYIDPSLSAAAASGITRNTATFSWTVATPTDNLTNLYVGNQLIWGSSGIANATKTWLNNTLSPSFTFTNLKDGQIYTVYYETYNQADSAGHRTMASTTFTTLKSNIGAILADGSVPAAPTKPSGVFETLTSAGKTPQQRNIIIVVIVAIIGIIVYYGYMVQTGGKGGKGGKSRNGRRK